MIKSRTQLLKELYLEYPEMDPTSAMAIVGHHLPDIDLNVAHARWVKSHHVPQNHVPFVPSLVSLTGTRNKTKMQYLVNMYSGIVYDGINVPVQIPGLRILSDGVDTVAVRGDGHVAPLAEVDFASVYDFVTHVIPEPAAETPEASEEEQEAAQETAAKVSGAVAAQVKAETESEAVAA